MLYRNITATVAILLLAQGSWAKSPAPEIATAAMNGSAHLTDSTQYTESLKSLLGKSWTLNDGPIHIWSKSDPKAQAKPDHSELQERVVTDPSTLEPLEVGMEPGFALELYAGPLVVQYNGAPYVFAISYDNRPYGYDAARCFIFYRPLESLARKDLKTNLAELDCKDAEIIRKAETFPLPKGFSSLTNDGKKLLTDLSNQNWVKERELPGSRHNKFDPDTYTAVYKESLNFSFWNNFTLLQYTANVFTNGPTGSAYPTEEVVQLGMRKNGNGTTDLLIWAHRTGFTSLDVNKMIFDHIDSPVWSLKNVQDIQASRSSKFYCYAGYDCDDMIKAEKARLWNLSFQTISAEYIILTYDPVKTDQLAVHFELVDPQTPSLTTTYRSR